MVIPSIRFVQTAPFGKLAKIEGSATCKDGVITLELSMTESVSGPVKGVIKRHIALSELEDVTFKRRWIRKSQVTFKARSLTALEDVPGAKGFLYTVESASPAAATRSFVGEARLGIAQATMDQFIAQADITAPQSSSES